MNFPAKAGLWLLLAIVPAAAEDSSLPDLNIEFTEAKLTLQSVTEENEALKKQASLLQDQMKSLVQRLAAASNEAEVFRKENGQLRLRMEALGIDVAAPDRTKLEQRLLKAVRDLQLMQDEKDKLTDQLLQLTEAVLRFLKTAENVDPDARLSLETQIRATNEALGIAPPDVKGASAVSATLTDASVISIKKELALIVANIGQLQGVQMGMPFQVWRGSTQVATVRVVDVRQKICGAVIQDLKSEEQIAVGDRLRVDAQQ